MGVRIAGRGTVPDGTAECSDVDPGWIVRIDHHAMPPFEVESLNACPMSTTVGGAVSRRVESCYVKRVWMARVDGQIVHMLRLGEESLPCRSAII